MNYLYIGPMGGVTLKADGSTCEVLLVPGKAVDLPENHEYTSMLLARGLLKPIAPAKAAGIKKTTKGA
ncbi:MAG: hypothetical protein FWG52_09705 [Proteobacteria bacterium]|jgi:hypothetical protein|nr:hypothetical protein [Pseudomonadota bacterium]